MLVLQFLFQNCGQFGLDLCLSHFLCGPLNNGDYQSMLTVLNGTLKVLRPVGE